jgi:hypothetical protein
MAVHDLKGGVTLLKNVLDKHSYTIILVVVSILAEMAIVANL